MFLAYHAVLAVKALRCSVGSLLLIDSVVLLPSLRYSTSRAADGASLDGCAAAWAPPIRAIRSTLERIGKPRWMGVRTLLRKPSTRVVGVRIALRDPKWM
jgi:hypothetical protein